MNQIRRIPRLLTALLVLAFAAVTLSACTSSADDQSPATYSPAAYYQTIGGVSDCYYADDPGEVTALINAGLCPAHSVAVIMPVSWEEEYWAYYSSPAYYNVYMPVSYRSRYTSVTVVKFSKTYSRQISTAESKAVYRSSKGGTVTGSKVNTTQFGSGSRTVKSYGGGSRSGSTTSNTKSNTYRSGSYGRNK